MKFFCTLFLVFMTLKLTGFIEWSWFSITAPLWGGVIFCFKVQRFLKDEKAKLDLIFLELEK